MPLISAQDAAKIAREHGLTLSDASAISRMAETIEEGTALAEMFASPTREDPRKLADDVPRL